MQKYINPSWTRFLLVFLLLNAFPTLLVAATISDRDSWPAAFAVVVLQVGLSAFVIVAWTRLRRANEALPIAITDVERIREIVVGPFVPLRTWLRRAAIVLVAIALLCLVARALGL